MECLAFHLSNNHVGTRKTPYYRMTMSRLIRLLGGSMKNHFHTWIGTSWWK